MLVGCGSESAFKTDGSAPGVSPEQDPFGTIVPTTAVAPSGTIEADVEFRPVLSQTLSPTGTTALCEPGDPSAVEPVTPITAIECEGGVVTSTYELGPSLLDGSATESSAGDLAARLSPS